MEQRALGKPVMSSNFQQEKKEREDRLVASGINSQFLETHTLSQINQHEITNLNNYVTINESVL